MSDYRKDIEKLKSPENIKDAVYASSPYVLRKAFQNDPIVLRLIKAGRAVVPLIQQEFAANGLKLNEITLACLVYVLEHVEPKSAPSMLSPLLQKALEKPGPFFVNFATHMLRQEAKLPVRPLEMVYRKAEVLETLEKFLQKH